MNRSKLRHFQILWFWLQKSQLFYPLKGAFPFLKVECSWMLLLLSCRGGEKWGNCKKQKSLYRQQNCCTHGCPLWSILNRAFDSPYATLSTLLTSYTLFIWELMVQPREKGWKRSWMVCYPLSQDMLINNTKNRHSRERGRSGKN